MALLYAYQKNALTVVIVKSCDRDSWEHALNYSQYIVLDRNKHFKFDLDRKLNLHLKFEPNILTWVPNFKIEKGHSVSAIFLIYSIFSNRNQMSLFSRKAYDKLITMTGKKGGVPMLVGELQPFFN